MVLEESSKTEKPNRPLHNVLIDESVTLMFFIHILYHDMLLRQDYIIMDFLVEDLMACTPSGQEKSMGFLLMD